MSSGTRRAFMLIAVFALLSVPVAAGALGNFGGPIFGIGTAPNGDLLVADAGAGVHTVRNGVITSTIEVPGATDISAIGKSSIWVTTGPANDPTTDDGQGIHRISKGKVRTVANLFAFENAYDPDGAGVDSNPFDVQSLGGKAALVVDAGGNDLLRVDNQGNITVLAVFPDSLVSTDHIKNLVGCPNPSPLCELPAMMPAQAVPTSVAVGPDGWYYVGELTGFPAPTGESGIWKVAPWASWASCPSADCVEVFSGGFTSVIDLAFGPDGHLYVAELDEDSWAAVEFLGGGSGGTINACNVSTLDCDEVATEIPILTSITFGKDGSLWASRNALIPGLAEVFEVD